MSTSVNIPGGGVCTHIVVSGADETVHSEIASIPISDNVEGPGRDSSLRSLAVMVNYLSYKSRI